MMASRPCSTSTVTLPPQPPLAEVPADFPAELPARDAGDETPEWYQLPARDAADETAERRRLPARDAGDETRRFANDELSEQEFLIHVNRNADLAQTLDADLAADLEADPYLEPFVADLRGRLRDGAMSNEAFVRLAVEKLDRVTVEMLEEDYYVTFTSDLARRLENHELSELDFLRFCAQRIAQLYSHEDLEPVFGEVRARMGPNAQPRDFLPRCVDVYEALVRDPTYQPLRRSDGCYDPRFLFEVAELKRAAVAPPPDEAPPSPPAAAPSDDATPSAPSRLERKLARRLCAACGARAPLDGPALDVCDGCGEPRYCGVACQALHWNWNRGGETIPHKYECLRRSFELSGREPTESDVAVMLKAMPPVEPEFTSSGVFRIQETCGKDACLTLLKATLDTKLNRVEENAGVAETKDAT